MKYALPVTIVVLIGLVAVLGYSIYSQYSQTSISVPSTSTKSNSTPQPKQKVTGTQTKDPSWYASLNPEQRYLLNTNISSLSQEQKKIYTTSVRKFAKDDTELVIDKECQPTPLVLRLKNGSEFKITNKDSVPHKISLTADKIFMLTANDSSATKADIGLGVYTYGCDGRKGGFLVINPQ